MMIDLTMTDAPERHRYEAILEGDVVGVLDYRRDDAVTVLTHAGVDRELEGNGIGTRLVRHALDDLRAQGRRVVPRCSFVAAFVRDNPDYRDLVAR